MNKNRTIYIDVSILVRTDLHTGIQRVVKSILDSLFNKNLHIDANLIPVYRNKDNEYRVANQFLKWCKLECYNIDYEIKPECGDIFLGLDLDLDFVDLAICKEFLLKIKRNGVKLVYLVYDILPLLYEDYFEEHTRKNFKKWFEFVSKNATELICISKTVKTDLIKYTNNSKLKIEYFYLGTYLDKYVIEKDKKIEGTINFLMVGTVEPRKGYNLLIDAFERLWSCNKNVTLTIIGKKGWNVDDIIHKIENSNEYNDRLIWLSNASDSELITKYLDSDCLVYTSEAEGYGLPISEALSYNLPVIARNIPVFNEISKEIYIFENINDSLSLSNNILEWITLYKQNKHPNPKDYTSLSWRDSTKCLMSKIL